VLAALAGATTLLLWLIVYLLGRRQIDRAAKETARAAEPAAGPSKDDCTTETTESAETAEKTEPAEEPR
jgi:flagellar biosynthesis/type III secretory pathway M-ring protein FliF/YscJ